MFSSKKPYSSVTVSIERLTSEQFEEDDLSGIPDLVEAIKLQSTGPTEAARAIRKKLKYGSVDRQLRALTILDGLIQNAGSRFQRTFADEPLLERLRVCASSDMSDKLVRDKCRVLFAQWAASYRKTPGLESICSLHKQQPRRKAPVTEAQSKVIRETAADPFEDGEEDRPAPTHERSKPSISDMPSSSQAPPKKSQKEKEKERAKNEKILKNMKKKASKPFNLEAEKPNLKATIADSSIKSTNLLNTLQTINRETEQVSDNATAKAYFEDCKQLRRRVLRYIHYIDDGEWLGSLLSANDNLVQALMTYEQLDRSIDADSDSDDDAAEQAHAYRMLAAKGKANVDADGAQQLAGLHIGSSSSPPAAAPSMPPRPKMPEPEPEPEDEEDDIVEEDENDPFADRNAVATPRVERGEPTWKVV